MVIRKKGNSSFIFGSKPLFNKTRFQVFYAAVDFAQEYIDQRYFR
jgi:hypothetical protein